MNPGRITETSQKRQRYIVLSGVHVATSYFSAFYYISFVIATLAKGIYVTKTIL